MNMVFIFIPITTWNLTDILIIFYVTHIESFPEGSQPFWISRELVAWPWCDLAASQRRPYCAFVNSHSPVGLVSRQWDAVDWACVLCDHRIHNDWGSISGISRHCACPFYSPRTGFFGQSITSPRSVSPPPLQLRFDSLPLLAFPRAQTAVEREEIFECDGHTLHNLSQRRLTVYRLAPRESDWSRMHSKVFSDWLRSYIKATRTVLEIFKLARYFTGSSCTCSGKKVPSSMSLLTVDRNSNTYFRR
jgi:hypothetical protein